MRSDHTRVGLSLGATASDFVPKIGEQYRILIEKLGEES